MKSEIPDIEAGLASADCRLDVAAPMARLLRPLVRLCIRSGMTFPSFAQLLRELFVNVAERIAHWRWAATGRRTKLIEP